MFEIQIYYKIARSFYYLPFVDTSKSIWEALTGKNCGVPSFGVFIQWILHNLCVKV